MTTLSVDGYTQRRSQAE